MAIANDGGAETDVEQCRVTNGQTQGGHKNLAVDVTVVPG
jgi:hypothetical protein